MTAPQPVCPHCRKVIHASEDAWTRLADDDNDRTCPLCGGTLADAAEERRPRRGWPPLLKFGLSMAVLGGLMVGLNAVFGVLSFRDNPGQILYELVFAGLIAAYLASGRTAGKLKGLVAWALIFAVGMLGYAFRHDLAAVKNRLLGALIPEFGTAAGERTLQFHVGQDGHFHIRATVDGVPIRFLVDTGASHIVLAPGDAARLGLDRQRLTYDKIYATANGMVRGASIRVAHFQVSQLHLRDVRASVNEAPMGESLLGMTFFNRLQRYTVADDVLTIEWAER